MLTDADRTLFIGNELEAGRGVAFEALSVPVACLHSRHRRLSWRSIPPAAAGSQCDNRWRCNTNYEQKSEH